VKKKEEENEEEKKRKYLNKPLPVIVTNQHFPPHYFRESYNLERIERDMTKLFMNVEEITQKQDLTPTEEILSFKNREHKNNINNFDWRMEPII